MAKLLLLDIIDNDVKEVECNHLDDYYKYLRCDCFDIANRELGGKRFDIFVDDEGLLKDNPIVSAISPDHEPMLVGNLILPIMTIRVTLQASQMRISGTSRNISLIR